MDRVYRLNDEFQQRAIIYRIDHVVKTAAKQAECGEYKHEDAGQSHNQFEPFKRPHALCYSGKGELNGKVDYNHHQQRFGID